MLNFNYPLIILLLLGFHSKGQISVTLTSEKDAVIHSLNPNVNYGNSEYFTAAQLTESGVPYTQRSMIYFDLTSIPIGSVINEAKILLYAENHMIIDQPTESVLLKITSSWDQNTVVWDNQPSTTHDDMAILSNAVAVDEDYEVDITTMIDYLVHNPDQNFGMMIKLQTDDGGNEIPYAALQFGSEDNATYLNRPRLYIDYTPPFNITASVVPVDPASETLGSISVSVPDGSPPYTYFWSNGETTSSIENLTVGEYTVWVTDNNNDVVSKKISLLNEAEWGDVNGASVSGNELTKTASTAWGNAGAFSVDALEPFNDGYMSYTKGSGDIDFAIGFSETNIDDHYNTIDYAFYLSSPDVINIYESGTNVGTFGNIATNDVISIHREGSTIIYKHNGTILRAVSTDVGEKLRLDASLYTSSTTIKTVYLNYGSMRANNYAELAKKLDGGFYYTNNSKLRFKYKEDYHHSSDNLTYKIYNSQRALVTPSSTVPSPMNKNSGDNWYELNVSNLTKDEYYTLEVENDKNEKLFLRFKRASSPGGGFSEIKNTGGTSVYMQ